MLHLLLIHTIFSGKGYHFHPADNPSGKSIHPCIDYPAPCMHAAPADAAANAFPEEIL